MTTFIWIQKSYTHESWHFRHKMGKIHRSLSTSKHLRYSQIELSRNRYGKKSYEFPAEDAVTALASFDAPAFPEAPSEETPSSLEVTGANPPAVAPPPRWTKTWFELVELVVLPLPAPDAPDALAADDASADGAGDSPCCDVPDADEFPPAEAAAIPVA